MIGHLELLQVADRKGDLRVWANLSNIEEFQLFLVQVVKLSCLKSVAVALDHLAHKPIAIDGQLGPQPLHSLYIRNNCVHGINPAAARLVPLDALDADERRVLYQHSVFNR